MPEPRIEADVTYDHDKYGDVLVTGIAKMYDEWPQTPAGSAADSPSASEKEDIESGNVLVFFYDNYDGYGGMNPMPMSEPVDEFSKKVDCIGPHEYVDSDLYEGRADR